METDGHLERITTLSRRLRLAVRAIAALITIALMVVVFNLGSGTYVASIDISGTSIPLEAIQGSARLVLLGGVLPFFGIVVWLLWQTDRLLGLYERGQVFAAECGRRIRRCGQALVALAVLDTVVAPLLVLLASRAGSLEGEIALEPSLGLFLGGFFVIVVGHVTGLGAEMAEDQALTI